MTKAVQTVTLEIYGMILFVLMLQLALKTAFLVKTISKLSKLSNLDLPGATGPLFHFFH